MVVKVWQHGTFDLPLRVVLVAADMTTLTRTDESWLVCSNSIEYPRVLHTTLDNHCAISYGYIRSANQLGVKSSHAYLLPDILRRGFGQVRRSMIQTEENELQCH